MEPELFTAMQILARVRRNFTDRPAFDHAFEVENGKIFHLQSALRNIGKIG